MSSPAAAAGQQPPEPATSLANRYGRPKRRLSKRAKVILSCLLLLAMILGVLFLSTRNTKTFEPKDVAFSLVSARQTDVTVAVSMEAGDKITCGIQVLSEDFGVVGYKEVLFDGSAEGLQPRGGRVTVQHKVPIRTVFEGVSGGSDSCWTS